MFESHGCKGANLQNFTKKSDPSGKNKKIMTKHFALILLTSLLFFSCQTDEVRTHEQAPAAMDSIQKALSDKLRLDSIDCEGIMRRSAENKGLFKATCPSDTNKGIPVSLRKTFPFDTLITKTKDTLHYSFRVSSACCVKYFGMFFDDGEGTLILTYGYCGDVCDCYCDHLLTYKIPLKKYKFKRIAIGFLDMKNIRDKSGHRS